MFSITIPTFNNLEYLKLCLHSLKKNSNLKHEIIIHVNDGSDGTLDFVKKNNYKYTYSKENIGVCKAVNLASGISSFTYILYAHDDMYFCPNWDSVLMVEVSKLNTNYFYLSGTMIESNGGHVVLDCGSNPENFDENKLLKNYKSQLLNNFQGSHWAPHLIHKDVWKSVGGLSEEFFGAGSDPDLVKKLWDKGIRIFKGLSDFRVYHFGSIVSNRVDNSKSRGTRIFILKWKISPKFFIKYFLKGGNFKSSLIITRDYDGPLEEPKKKFDFYLNLTICFLKYIYLKIFY